jgi:mannose-1-phosphate guanylyltransferase
MTPSNYYGLIMAGGRGTRFWPRSRRAHAKQVLNVFGDRSLIQQTVDRLSPLIPPERLWILTNDYVRDEVVRQLPQVPEQQIVAEPAQRNTAPCIGVAAHILESIDPGAVFGVFPSDHVIGKPEHYLELLGAAFRAAEGGRIVVLGVQPRWPETGYGYIEFEPEFVPGALAAVPVRGFREKPGLSTAKEFVAAGNYYWNAGMFFWRAKVFLEALRTHLPRTAEIIDRLPRFADPAFSSRFRETYEDSENISVDYAVLEKSSNVVGIPADDFEWNDVGSWDAVYELMQRDGQGNASCTDLLAEASSGNYVDAQGKLVALLGVEDLIVVDTPDALLIADRSRAQQVGDLVKILEKRKREDLL